jgi:hypothetical protein
MLIIALAGAKGCGKSAAAEAIEEGDNSWVRLSFADPMKDMLRCLGLTTQELYGNEKEKPLPHLAGTTARKLMQTIGTEWGRDLIDPDLWVFAMAHRISLLSPTSKVIIDDVRFNNELSWLRGIGATVIGIERGELREQDDYTHISEQMPYQFKRLGIPVVKNNSSIAALHQEVVNLSTPPV